MFRKVVRVTALCLVFAFILALAACEKTGENTSDDAYGNTAETPDTVQDPLAPGQPVDDDSTLESDRSPVATDELPAVYTAMLTDERLASADHWVQEAVLQGAADARPDFSVLTAFYESADDLAMLRLFPTRFCDSMNTDDELAIAAQTAHSLANFILQNMGVKALFEPVTDEVKTEWLHSIGVMREYTDPYEGYLDALIVTGLNPLVAEYENATFTLYAYADPYSPALGFDTAARIESFLFREMHGIEYINGWLAENAGSNYNLVVIPNQVKYLNGADIRYGYADRRRQTVYHANTIGHLHEYIHIILSRYPGWRSEGFAVYLSEIVYPYHYRRILFEEYGLGVYLGDDSIEKYGAFIREQYARYSGGVLEYPHDMRALIDTFALALLSDEDDGHLSDYFIFMPIYKLDNLSLTGDDIGNEMSRYEAASFIAFLSDVYSFETTLRMVETWVSLESIFGKSYDELRSDWIAWLNR